MTIQYKAGYKYQLAAPYVCDIFIRPDSEVGLDFISLKPSGRLRIKKGYAWDGPSGPAIDTKNFMRGSLAHDALYQLMRHGLLGDHLRDSADRLLQQMCIEDGMWKIRALWVYKSLRWFGGAASDPENQRPVITAP